jgi:hypothetical protein
MFIRALSILGLVLLPLQIAAISRTGSSVLILLGPELNPDDFSLFFDGLKRTRSHHELSVNRFF